MVIANPGHDSSSKEKGWWISERILFDIIGLVVFGLTFSLLYAVIEGQFLTNAGISTIVALLVFVYLLYHFRRRRSEPVGRNLNV